MAKGLSVGSQLPILNDLEQRDWFCIPKPEIEQANREIAIDFARRPRYMVSENFVFQEVTFVSPQRWKHRARWLALGRERNGAPPVPKRNKRLRDALRRLAAAVEEFQNILERVDGAKLPLSSEGAVLPADEMQANDTFGCTQLESNPNREYDLLIVTMAITRIYEQYTQRAHKLEEGGWHA